MSSHWEHIMLGRSQDLCRASRSPSRHHLAILIAHFQSETRHQQIFATGWMTESQGDHPKSSTQSPIEPDDLPLRATETH